MIGDPRRHRGRPRLPAGQGQTGMHRAEVVQATHQVHPGMQQLLAMHQMMRPPGQRCQPRPERAIQPFHIGGVQHPTPRRLRQQLLRLRAAAPAQAPCDPHHPLADVLLDHLADHQVGPRHLPWRAPPTVMHAQPKRLPKGVDIAGESVDDQQQWRHDRRGGNQGDDAGHHALIAAGADRAAQPAAGGNHQRHRHPDDPALGLDAYFIRLYLAQVARLGNLRMMDCFGMCPGCFEPVPDGLGLEAIGMLNGDERTAPTDQGDDADDQRLVRPAAIEGRASARAEGLGADVAAVAALLLAMHADVALAGQAELGHHTACGFMDASCWFVTQDCPRIRRFVKERRLHHG